MEAEDRYWDDHYAGGGVSGEGSVGALRAWKWEKIHKYCPALEDVVDVGCGDLSFWDGQPWPRDYIGLDLSKTICDRNRETHRGTFICTPADRVDLWWECRIGKAQAVLCMDMLFHVMDDDAYEQILGNLCRWSSEWVFVYTWEKNPLLQPGVRQYASGLLFRSGHPLQALRVRLGSDTDYRYQKYRDFGSYLPTFRDAGFFLEGVADGGPDPWGALYVFRKETSPVP